MYFVLIRLGVSQSAITLYIYRVGRSVPVGGQKYVTNRPKIKLQL